MQGLASRLARRELRSRMEIVGAHPGSFRRSGKQRAYRIRNLEVCTEDGRRVNRERFGGDAVDNS